ncbi:MAG TPA: hypothetical protein VF032_08340 [Thermoleophilaceae bacterium]
MRGTILAGVVVSLAMAVAAPAFGASVKPWDGKSPFICTIQYAGEGTTFQHPNADPFCVDYDKTHQDISQLGVVTFLSKEPARLAAAINKCWYYQQDHWTGQVIAGDGSTETYHWDGHYFFDKRWGAGGVYVENFTINHRTADPSQLPGFPAAWKPYFGPGRGGVMMLGQVKADPRCQYHGGTGPSPYVNEGAISGQKGGGAGGGKGGGSGGGAHPGAGGKLRARACRAGGAARHGLGPAHLGQSRAALTRRLGKPTRRARGIVHFCALAVHFGRHGRADFIASASRSFHSGRARVGTRLRAARAALHHERVLAHHGSVWVFAVSHRGWRLIVGVKRGRVNFLIAASSRLSNARVGGLFIASRL